MTQRPLFAKAKTFKRPRRVQNRYNDFYKVWPLADGSGKVVLVTQICGVRVRPSFKAVILNSAGEYMISRHRKLRAAQAALIKATEPKPEKRRKVRR